MKSLLLHYLVVLASCSITPRKLLGVEQLPYKRLNQTLLKCEEPHVLNKGWSPVPPWTNTGANPIAIAIYGSVSYATVQAHSVDGLYSRGGDFEFVAVGPLARQYERNLILPNNGQVDVFLFSWAPTVALQTELLRLYRPFASRFENQSHWIPHFEKASDYVNKLSESGSSKRICEVKVFSLSQYMSIYLSLEMMHKHEHKRGWRYERVVICRPDTNLHRVMQLSSYDVDHYVYHNNGNSNTGDMIFIMSSVSAESFSCIPRYVLSASWYECLGAHKVKFLPELIPGITDMKLEQAHGDNHRTKSETIDMMKYTGPTMQLDEFLEAHTVEPYRREWKSSACSFPFYDRYNRARCASYNASHHGADGVCTSLQRVETASLQKVEFIANITQYYRARNTAPPPTTSLREVCTSKPSPPLDKSNHTRSEVESLMQILLGIHQVSKQV